MALDLLAIAHPNAKYSASTIMPKSTLPNVLARQTQYLASMAKTINDQRDNELKDLAAITDISTKGMRFNDLNKINSRLKDFDKFASETTAAYRMGKIDSNEARIRIMGMKKEVETVVNKSIADAQEFDDWIKWVGTNADKLDVPSVMKIANDWSNRDPVERGTFPKEQLYVSLKKPFDLDEFFDQFTPTAAKTSFDNPDYGTDKTVANLKDIETQIQKFRGTDTWTQYMKWGLAPEDGSTPKFTNEQEAINYAKEFVAAKVGKSEGYTVKDNSDTGAKLPLPEGNIQENTRNVVYSPPFRVGKASKTVNNVASVHTVSLNTIPGLSNIPLGVAQIAQLKTVSPGYDKTTQVNATFESIEYMVMASENITLPNGTTVYKGMHLPKEYVDRYAQGLQGKMYVEPVVQIRVSDANRAETDPNKYSTVSIPYGGWVKSILKAQAKFGEKGDKRIEEITSAVKKKFKTTQKPAKGIVNPSL